MSRASENHLARFQKGSGPMDYSAIDYYSQDGKIIRHEWAMGGESFKHVKDVPKTIKGYERVTL